MRAELRGLSQSMADIVGAHLMMAGQLLDSDPELAYSHAEAARRRAARLPITREAAGEAAYAAGKYEVALTEFRALRRMRGGEEYLAAMADCERALGNPDKGLRLAKEGLNAAPDFAGRVELRLVEAGCRMDLDQPEEALRLLRQEIESAAGKGSRLSRVRLRYGYADVLEQTGDSEQAEKWFEAAAALDADAETDAVDRVAALQGMVLEVDEEDFEEEEAAPDPSDETVAEAVAEGESDAHPGASEPERSDPEASDPASELEAPEPEASELGATEGEPAVPAEGASETSADAMHGPPPEGEGDEQS